MVRADPRDADPRYTFFYMPFDKRRNVHCGFAFINFRSGSPAKPGCSLCSVSFAMADKRALARTPSDVLVLWQRMTRGAWDLVDPRTPPCSTLGLEAVLLASLPEEGPCICFGLSSGVCTEARRERSQRKRSNGVLHFDPEPRHRHYRR